MTAQIFRALIIQSGGRTFITLPFDPNDVWGVKSRHHVIGSINGHAVRGALGRDGKQYFLPLGAAWYGDNGVAAGAGVDVVLSPEGPQIESLPPDVAEALEAEPDAQAFFESLATFYRKAYLKWIEGAARRPEIRAARIEEMVRLLKAGRKQR